MKKPVRTALKTTLNFEPVLPASDPNWDQYWPVQEWVAADEKYAFRIMREFNVDVSFYPFFVAHASRLDDSKRNQISCNLKTFEAAVRLCSNFTRTFRRQIAYHEAGHAVVARLLGYSGVWIDMKADKYRSVVWYAEAAWDVLANGEHAARDLYKSLLFSVAGLVAEVRIAGYPPPAYVEKDATGFAIVPWLAARVARLEAGLTICGHKDCEIPFDAERIAAVTKRAEDEAFALLKANWAIVKRLANALCRRDRLTTTELDALLGPAPTR
jgi:hypothetical protein